MYKGSLAEFGLLPAARCRVIANELRLDLPGLATEVETIRDPPDLPSDGP
jgi:hypothetical protein